MTRRTRHRLLGVCRYLAAGLTALLAGVLGLAACERSKPVGPGGECFLATDCAPGLVCVEQANKSRVCSDDLARVAGRNPPEAGVDVDAASADAAQPDGATPVRDSSAPETGAPDTGTPPEDSGSDAGSD